MSIDLLQNLQQYKIMNDSHKSISKVEEELTRLLDYYIQKIEYHLQLKDTLHSEIHPLLLMLKKHKLQLLEDSRTDWSGFIKSIQLELQSSDGEGALEVKMDFLEELDLFQIRHGLEENK